MTSFQYPIALRLRLNKLLAPLTLAVALTGCSNVHTGAGIHMNVPILPGVSVGVNGAGQVTGRAGVGTSTSGPVNVGAGAGVGGVLYDPKK